MNPPPGRALVCFALPEEARPFLRRARQEDAQVLLTGMGRRNTERALLGALARSRPALVLTCGFAGALAPDLVAGQVLFETADAALADRLRKLGLRPALFHCAERMAVTAAAKSLLRRSTQADAVEMESAAVHAICGAHALPCATVRVISDTAEQDLPLDFNAFTTPEMKLDLVRLALAVARAPGRIPALLRLQRQTARAAAALAEALVRFLRPG